MSNLSRVQKNQILRTDVENDREERLVSPALSSYAERLKKISPVLSKVDAQASSLDYQPMHTRREQAYQSDLKTHESRINSQVMDEFLEEVKSYTLEKGYRHLEDTVQEVLKPKPKQEVHIEDALDIDPVNEEIRRLIHEDFTEPSITEPAEKVEESTHEDIQAVIEETQKLRVQLTEYEKGLVDMNESVLSSNRILNIVVFVLVLVLMIMLGIAIYWVLYSKGFY